MKADPMKPIFAISTLAIAVGACTLNSTVPNSETPALEPAARLGAEAMPTLVQRDGSYPVKWSAPLRWSIAYVSPAVST